ncbi:MAG: hypothetical protein A2655_02265 [Candidatus Yanofskybacteria bacterium RIFCSPHIGHO2_01_FULL_43_42]|uniref:DUF192 domain-containing protein n=1 Tax=Candidatus Yanofskybacteria bacterium RIFCSPLOWO2_01_FULL_43_22 TaxID=1802695 RepID=A0A1F8GJ46_9BACT|nr:MAG: hypothetical protein A2655_02265 [Candidatus Yanofskybacteria bacterium RIFCSPHIGHO2_01_FULL_43_42]OGN13290.1 MAG: hypothetical protein A3D48_03170 [Candidatus Yanofskybacteria bacterium RIFCSPHIGHO2_02_FULL_43_17]OGN24706.1 MAG: hypothetical protein A3A13_01395 [Candidatus Yanofskybacteria bacterium RIFCSPLOWO2_01_FULL_43_22]
MKIKKTSVLVFVFLTGLLVFGGLFVLRDRITSISKESAQQPPTIQINGWPVEILLARTSEEQMRGLSGRTVLPENQGMLFLYDEPGFYSFWMKDMQFPIDIIWIDENYIIIDITKDVLPGSFPQIFQSQKPAQYVLEVNAGFVEKNSVEIGNILDLSEALSGY